MNMNIVPRASFAKNTRIKGLIFRCMLLTGLDSHSGAVLSCGQFVYFFFALAQTGLIAVTLLLQGFQLHVQLHALPWQP